MALISFCRKKEAQSGPSDGSLSISFTERASEDAQRRDLKGEKVKVECQQRENEVGDGREEERGCNISITKKAAGDQRSHGG